MGRRSPIGRLETRMKTLNKRADCLQKRVEEGKKKGIDLSWDRAELGAITWAIYFIEENIDLAIQSIKFKPSKKEEIS